MNSNFINIAFLTSILSFNLFYFFEKILSIEHLNKINKKQLLRFAVCFGIFFLYLSFLYFVAFFLREKVESIKEVGLFNVLKFSIGVNLFLFMKIENLNLKVKFFFQNDLTKEEDALFKGIYYFSTLLFDLPFLWLNFSTIFFYKHIIYKNFYLFSLPCLVLIFIFSCMLFKINSKLRLNNEKIFKVCFLLNAVLNGISLFKIV